MRRDHWILEGRTPVPVDLLTWVVWYEDVEKRRLADDSIGASRVSTVFLGLDHNFAGTGPPILFETLVFNGPLDGECNRYVTYDEAEAGHTAMLMRVTEAMEAGHPDEDLPHKEGE
jgi:hypothetical protein